MLSCGITGSKGNLGRTFLKKNNKFNYIRFRGDISKKKDVFNWIKNNEFDLIIHFAALVPTLVVNKDYKKALNINYNGTKNLVDAIKKYKKKIEWFFFASTSHVYPLQNKKIKENFRLNPSSNYGKTKLYAENYIKKGFKNSNIKFCVGRIFSIFDNKDKSFFTPSLAKKIKQKSNKLVLNNLNHYRDFLTTDQISKIILVLWKKKFEGTINIGSGKKINLKEVAKNFAIKSNKKISFGYNKPSCLVADVSKLRKLGLKYKKINFSRFFN